MDLAGEIADLVAQIPPGRVATFADVAEGLGDPRAAMAVFRILKDAPTAGMHRVVRASAHTPFPLAAGLLRREGVAGSPGQVGEPERRRLRGVFRLPTPPPPPEGKLPPSGSLAH